VLSARGFEQLLLTICNSQKAILIESANVAGLEPAVFRKDGARRLGFVVIPAHYIWTTSFNFSVSCNAHFDVSNRFANSTNAIFFQLSRCNHWRGFGKPVSLNNRNACTQIDVPKLFR